MIGRIFLFDHHNWHVETTAELNRCVIDYYYQEESSSNNENESDEDKNVLIFVRPTLHSFSSFCDKCHSIPCARHMYHATNFVPFPFMPTKTLQNE